MGAAREVLFDDVVLRRAAKRLHRHAGLFGARDVEREQPSGRRVDGHRGVHLAEGELGEERAHVTQMRDGHPDLADLASSEDVVGIVAGLGGQIEGDAQPRLTLGEVAAEERVGVLRGAMTRIGAHDPGPASLGRRWRHGGLFVGLVGSGHVAPSSTDSWRPRP